MKKPKFKKGEWCFCEFALQQVIETEGDKITAVSDGYVRHASSDLSDRCFELNFNNKLASEKVQEWSKKFLRLKGGSINHPDLNRELIRMWILICKAYAINGQYCRAVEVLFADLSNFGNGVISAVDKAKEATSNGIPVFK